MAERQVFIHAHFAVERAQEAVRKEIANDDVGTLVLPVVKPGIAGLPEAVDHGSDDFAPPLW